jgi:hypothetical protein
MRYTTKDCHIVPIFASPVKKILPGRRFALVLAGAAWIGVGCGYHVGRPPVAAGSGLAIGAIMVPVAEAGLPEALAQGLADAIRRRDVAGTRAISATVSEASFVPAFGSGGEVGAWKAELAVDFGLSGPRPRSLSLRRSTVVPAPPGGASGLPSARKTAFEALSSVLCEEAVAALALAPPEPVPDSPKMEDEQ